MQLSELPNPGLTETLLSKESESAARGQTSSHWRELHDRTSTAFGGDLGLCGLGFGNLRCHPLQLPLEKLTTFLHVRAARNKMDVLAGLKVLEDLFQRQPRNMRFQMTYDAARQVFAWAALKAFLPRKKGLTWCVIGDGYGVFSGLIKALYPDSKIFLIDLPKTLVFQTVFLQTVHPGASHALLREGSGADFVYCPAPSLPEAAGQIDVFVNVASMQEMDQGVIRAYFDFMRKTGAADHVFYCCNRVEKTLPDGETIRFDDYPWSKSDVVLLDELCPYFGFFLHLRRFSRGPRLFGARIPFVNWHDGDVRHRIARLR